MLRWGTPLVAGWRVTGLGAAEFPRLHMPSSPNRMGGFKSHPRYQIKGPEVACFRAFTFSGEIRERAVSVLSPLFCTKEKNL
jgi:hypothetical protein